MKKILVMLFVFPLFAALPIGEKPQTITLSGDAGGRVDGSEWSSTELVGKVWVMFYADPDEADLNNTASEALKAKNYDLDFYGSVAVVNMAATWKPNFAISMILKGKQKEYSTTTYVKDINKKLVKSWNLADDSNDIVIFNHKGEVLFSHDGQASTEQIGEMISIIDAEIKIVKSLRN